MKNLFVTVLAITLVIPIFLLIISTGTIPGWLFSERGYAMLTPLFRLFGAVGMERREDVVIGVLLLISFVIALALVAGGATMLRTTRR